MPLKPTPAEALLLLACAVLVAAALFGPSVGQPPLFHAYAEHRALWGIPHGLDVLSNIPFALAAVLGLRVLGQVPAEALPPVQRGCLRLFFIGLLVTAAGSAWYHLGPNDPGLAVDRLAMATAFAGLLGLAAATGVSERAGRALSLVLLVLAPAAVLGWYVTGNVLPWVLVQLGGMLTIVFAGSLRPAPAQGLQVRWILVLAAYALAKLFEVGDHVVFEGSGQLFSGHTLKHVVAAFAAWPVIASLAAHRRRQNGRHTAAQAA
jgi:hypothetical protein